MVTLPLERGAALFRSVFFLCDGSAPRCHPLTGLSPVADAAAVAC